MSIKPAFTEHRVPRDAGSVYARRYAGAGPTFVLMHGFPDNLGIYDDLVPHLVAAGREVVTFDFLGFGASDKPNDFVYSFLQQLGDLTAVVETLNLEAVVPVAHDSSGFAALNYALAFPGRVSSVVMLNSAYSEDDTVLWPELITLFADKNLRELAMALAASPAQFGWLLGWQQKKFLDSLPEAQKAHFSAAIGKLIADNFLDEPSSGPAFVQMAAQFHDEHARNAQRLPQVKALDVPVKLIWGEFDPYISLDVARRRLTQLKNASLSVISAGHWLQADVPDLVAKAMLS